MEKVSIVVFHDPSAKEIFSIFCVAFVLLFQCAPEKKKRDRSLELKPEGDGKHDI